MDVRLIEEIMYEAYRQKVHSDVTNEAHKLKVQNPKWDTDLRYKTAFKNITGKECK